MTELLDAIPLLNFIAGLDWAAIGKVAFVIACVGVWLSVRRARLMAEGAHNAVTLELTQCRKDRKQDHFYMLQMVQIVSESFGVMRSVTMGKRKPPPELAVLENRAKSLLATVIAANGIPS